MNRVARILAVAALVSGALTVGRLALPGAAFACICTPSGPIGTFADKPDYVVLAGTIVGAHRASTGSEVGTIEITHVFKGPVPRLRMVILGSSGDDCGHNIIGDAEVVMVATISQGAIRPGGCLPYGDLTTEEGRSMFDEAVAVYGTPVPGDEDRASVPGNEIALIGSVGLAVAIAAVMFLVIARRWTTT